LSDHYNYYCKLFETDTEETNKYEQKLTFDEVNFPMAAEEEYIARDKMNTKSKVFYMYFCIRPTID